MEQPQGRAPKEWAHQWPNGSAWPVETCGQQVRTRDCEKRSFMFGMRIAELGRMLDAPCPLFKDRCQSLRWKD